MIWIPPILISTHQFRLVSAKEHTYSKPLVWCALGSHVLATLSNHLFICLSTYPSTHQGIPSILSFTNHPPTYPSIYLSNYPSINPSIHPPTHPPTYPSIYERAFRLFPQMQRPTIKPLPYWQLTVYQWKSKEMSLRWKNTWDSMNMAVSPSGYICHLLETWSQRQQRSTNT